MRPTADILPCPFCGEIPDTFSEDDGRKWGSVVCCITGPEVRTGYKSLDHWRDDAIAAWNRRAPSTGEQGP